MDVGRSLRLEGVCGLAPGRASGDVEHFNLDGVFADAQSKIGKHLRSREISLLSTASAVFILVEASKVFDHAMPNGLLSFLEAAFIANNMIAYRQSLRRAFKSTALLTFAQCSFDFKTQSPVRDPLEYCGWRSSDLIIDLVQKALDDTSHAGVSSQFNEQDVNDLVLQLGI